MTFKPSWQGGRAPRVGKPLADFATRLLSPVLERRAGMTLDLLANWDQLAGPGHAAHCRPERLKWARADDDAFKPATLVIACEGSHAVFLQHETKLIIERLNAFFGFAAVDRIQIRQAPMVDRAADASGRTRPVPPTASRALSRTLETVEDEALRKALTRLGAGVEADGLEE